MVAKSHRRAVAHSAGGGSLATQAQQLFAQGFAWHRKGRLADAQRHYQAVLNLQARHFDALHLSGVIAFQIGQYGRAVDLIGRAIAVNPRDAAAHSNHGLALAALGQYAAAVPCYDRAVALRRDYAEAYYNRGRSLQALRQFDAALRDLDRAIALKPGFVEAHTNRGNVLRELGRADAALPSYRRALELQPDQPEHHYNLGLALAEVSRLEDALDSYDRAIELKPEFAEACTNRGITLQELGRVDAALASFDQAIASKPDLAEAHHYRALIHLACGNYALGWQGYEWRWKTRAWTSPQVRPAIPAWSAGASSEGKLLVWGEQGIGDEILYASMFQAAERFPQRTTVAVDHRLVTLFQRSFPAFEIVDRTVIADASAFSEQLPMGSLGRLFVATDDDCRRSQVSYLRADAAASQLLGRQLREEPRKLVCGLSWISKAPAIGAFKSLTLSDLLPVLGVQGVEFVDLQYGDTADERAALERTHGIRIRKVDHIDNFADIEGLAALIDACDLVITVSNTTAHLAGALGKQTWLMLPRGRGRHWYWRSQDDVCLWYPSVRILQQHSIGAWDAPVRELADLLRIARDELGGCAA